MRWVGSLVGSPNAKKYRSLLVQVRYFFLID